jgi:hypothetical protein
VDRRQHVLAGTEVRDRKRRRLVERPVANGEDGVVHHVPGHDDVAPDVVLTEGRRGVLRRSQKEVGAVVGEDAVYLLRHRPLLAAEPGLDVCQRRLALGRDQRRRERRVRVPVHQHDVG